MKPLPAMVIVFVSVSLSAVRADLGPFGWWVANRGGPVPGHTAAMKQLGRGWHPSNGVAPALS